jgi:hypothetical protein
MNDEIRYGFNMGEDPVTGEIYAKSALPDAKNGFKVRMHQKLGMDSHEATNTIAETLGDLNSGTKIGLASFYGTPGDYYGPVSLEDLRAMQEELSKRNDGLEFVIVD